MHAPLLLLLATSTSGTPPPSPSPAPEARVVARIGDYALTQPTFEAYWEALPPARRGTYEKEGGQRAFLEDLVDQKLIVAEAERRGYLDRPPLRVAAELARDAVLYRALVDEEITRPIVTEEAMRAYYATNKERYRVEERVRLRQIVATPYRDIKVANEERDDATTEAEAKEKIERLRREALAGADFAMLARRWSEDATAGNGGLLDDVPRGRLLPPVEEAAFGLAPEEVSATLRTPYGFHLVRVEERIPAHERPFHEVRDDLARGVAEEHKDEFRPRLKALAAELRAKGRVTVDASALPPAAPAVAPPAVPSPAASSPAAARTPPPGGGK